MTRREDEGAEFDQPSATLDKADVQRAKALATSAHHGQTDKAGRAYIGHPNRVVGYLVNPTAQESVVAWLHDVVEDTGVNLEVIENDFGPQVADAVDAITCRPGEAKAVYYARVKASPIALTVKAAAKYAHARRELGIT